MRKHRSCRDRRWVLALLGTLVVSCSTVNPPGTPPRQPAPTYPSEPAVTGPGTDPRPPPVEDIRPLEPEPDPAPAPEPDAGSTNNPLISRANAAAGAGNYDQALALLERAQRIDPTNADVYLALVRTYTAKGDTGQAQVTAERGLLYCRSNAQCDQLRAFIQ